VAVAGEEWSPQPGKETNKRKHRARERERERERERKDVASTTLGRKGTVIQR
jgi:hypothetical protein